MTMDSQIENLYYQRVYNTRSTLRRCPSSSTIYISNIDSHPCVMVHGSPGTCYVRCPETTKRFFGLRLYTAACSAVVSAGLDEVDGWVVDLFAGE